MMRFTIFLIFSLIALTSADQWPQQGYNWLQQNAGPSQGPQYIKDYSLRTIYNSPLDFYPTANDQGIIYAGIKNLITAYNSSTLAILWQTTPRVRYNQYAFYGSAVATDGSLIVAIGPSSGDTIQTFLTVASNGTITSQFDTTFPGTNFFLGPKNEIIVRNGIKSWTVAVSGGNSTYSGNPLAADDKGYVYVTNTSALVRVSLDDPSNPSWVFKYPSGIDAGISDLTLSHDQSSVLVLGDVSRNSANLISVSVDSGSLEWVFEADGVSTSGQIAVGPNNIFISYVSTTSLSSYSQITLTSDGYLMNTIEGKFGSSMLIVDSDSVVTASAASVYYNYLSLITRAVNGSVISQLDNYISSCTSSNTIRSLFFTNSTNLWISSSCGFFALGQNL